MISKEIKRFKLSVGEYVDIDVSVPCSVVSALHREKLIGEPYYGMNNAKIGNITELGARFVADFEIDTLMLGMDSLALRVGGVDAPAVVFVNGVPIARIEESSSVGVYDIKSNLHMGKNSLELRFDPRERADGDYVGDIAIFAPVELISYNKSVIDAVIVKQTHKDEKVRLDIEIQTIGYNRNPRSVAVIVSPGGRVNYCTMVDGKGWVELESPNLWRPGKLGAHNLYRMTVNLYADTELTDTKEYSIGLRSVELDSECAPMLKLSGQPYYPTVLSHSVADLIKPRATEEKISLILGKIAETGVDMLHISGRDTYPSEHFLTLCDELGISLIIDAVRFDKPTTPAEGQLARKMLKRSLSRLAMHPSVFIISGCPDLSDVIKGVMREVMPDVLYIPEIESAVTAPMSLMSAVTSRTFIPEYDMNPLSPSMTEGCSQEIGKLVSRVLSDYRMPSGYDDWRYLSGVLSAEDAVDKLIDSRLGSVDIGAFVADVGEPIPRPAPSMLDYLGREKAMYYHLSRNASPVSVYAIVEDAKIRLYAYNMSSIVYEAKLTYAINDASNVGVIRDTVDFVSEPFTVSMVHEFDASAIVAGHERDYYLSYFVTDGKGISSQGTRLFVTPRLFNFKKPTLDVELTGANTEYYLTVSTDAYARFVEISFARDDDVVLSDNYFDLTSTVRHRVRITTPRPTAVETLRRELKIRSMYDVGREIAEKNAD